MPNPIINSFQIGETVYDFSDSTKVPLTRTVNGLALSDDIELTPDDMEYDEEETYTAGTLGKKVADLSGEIKEIDENNLAAFVQETISDVAIASLTDGADDIPVKSLVVNVDPVQDLHGYDNPWPAGGSTNIWDEEWELGRYDTTTGNAVSSNNQIRSKNFVPVVPEHEYYFVANPYIWTLFYDSSKQIITEGLPDATGGKYAVSNNARGIGGAYHKTVTMPENCYYIKFYFQIDYGTSYKNDTAINKNSAVTTYSSYSNECPITGHTGANVPRTGKNMFDGVFEQGTFNNDGAPASSNTRIRTGYIPVKSGVTYRLSNYAENCTLHEAYVYDGSKRLIKKILGSAQNSFSYTMPDGTVYLRFSARYTDNSNISPSVGKAQLELGDVQTEYEEYKGTIYSITFPDAAGTVYGATLINEGTETWKMRVDRYFKELTGAEGYAWTGSFWTNKWTSNTGVIPNGVATPLAVCSHFPCGTTSDWGVATAASTRVGIPKNESLYTDSASVNTWLASQYANGTPVQFAAAITPIEYTLTTQQINTLLGINNIWADTGNVNKLIYRADTKLYIDKKIAEATA